MKESYVKGLANHNDPESCGGARKSDGEALTGESGHSKSCLLDDVHTVSTWTIRGKSFCNPAALGSLLEFISEQPRHLFELREYCERVGLGQWDDAFEELDQLKEVGTLIAHAPIHMPQEARTSQPLARSISLPVIT